MAKKLPPEGKRFKPGVSGNPGGKPKIPDDIKEARKLTQIELERTINALLFLDKESLQARIKDPKTPMIEMIAASIMAQAAVKGDHLRLDFILQRMIGKVKDQVEISQPQPYIVRKLDGEEIAMGIETKETQT